jgi:hypothetical protein
MLASSPHCPCLPHAIPSPGRLVRILSVATVVLLCLSHTASAAVLTVGGPGNGCNHTTVQAAVNAANSSAGADEIRIARSATWTAQQISINTTEEVRLIGGYANCTSVAPDGTKTVLSGAGGDARPVLTIRGNGFVVLRNLTIREGDQAGNDNGGGINFEGGGILDIADSAITANSANDGGGIYATGTSRLAEVVLGANVTVSSNIARNSGGGMVSKSLETSLVGPGTVIIFNEARGQNGGGYGGGLAVVSDEFASYAYISSSGTGGIGAVYSNEAKYGGGIAVLAGGSSEETSRAYVFSTDPQQPVRIHANRASVNGGGVHLKPNGNAFAVMELWHAAISDNEAPDGAAAFMDQESNVIQFDYAGLLYFKPIDGAANAPAGVAMNQIVGNTTGNATGAIIRSKGALQFDRVDVRENSGGRLFYLTDTPQTVISNSLIAENDVAMELIRSADEEEENAETMLKHVTIAGNTIGAPHALFVNHPFYFDRSLVAQPGKSTLAASPGERHIEYVLTNDTSNMTASFFLIDPRFIDPVNGDYHLRAGSFAVDFAPQVGGVDLEGRSHTIDMPNGGFTGRTADVGAYERPALQPLVLNSDFNSNLGFWAGLSESFWDGTTNVSGPVGSGSVRVPPVSDPEDVNAPRIVGRSQCVHLPGPGRYRLNGWGKVTSTMFESNSVRLRWELRYNGGAATCENGVYDLTNTHILATSNTWTRPANAAVIEVPEAVWTRNTSLTIKLDTSGNQTPPIGWFDGITLDIDNSDTIFKNGFESL